MRRVLVLAYARPVPPCTSCGRRSAASFALTACNGNPKDIASRHRQALPVYPRCYRPLAEAGDEDHRREAGLPAPRKSATPKSPIVKGSRIFRGARAVLSCASIPVVLSQTWPFGVHVYWQGLLCVTSIVASEAGLE